MSVGSSAVPSACLAAAANSGIVGRFAVGEHGLQFGGREPQHQQQRLEHRPLGILVFARRQRARGMQRLEEFLVPRELVGDRLDARLERREFGTLPVLRLHADSDGEAPARFALAREQEFGEPLPVRHVVDVGARHARAAGEDRRFLAVLRAAPAPRPAHKRRLRRAAAAETPRPAPPDGPARSLRARPRVRAGPRLPARSRRRRRQHRQPRFAPREHAADEPDEPADVVVEVLEQDRDGFRNAWIVRRQVRKQTLGRLLVQLETVLVDAESGAEAGEHRQAACRATG